MNFLQFPETDQEERIRKRRAELEKLAATITPNESLPMSGDMEEEFLRHVLEYETREPISLLKLLENSGIDVPAPDDLSDENLTGKLKEVINGMASMGAYLLHTNHYSDRELYEFLSDCLTEEVVLFPENPDYAYMIDMIGGVGNPSAIEDNQDYLKYYADDEQRRWQWAHDWPGYPIPEHEDPPFDRDRFLPQSQVG